MPWQHYPKTDFLLPVHTIYCVHTTYFFITSLSWWFISHSVDCCSRTAMSLKQKVNNSVTAWIFAVLFFNRNVQQQVSQSTSLHFNQTAMMPPCTFHKKKRKCPVTAARVPIRAKVCGCHGDHTLLLVIGIIRTRTASRALQHGQQPSNVCSFPRQIQNRKTPIMARSVAGKWLPYIFSGDKCFPASASLPWLYFFNCFHLFKNNAPPFQLNSRSS